MNVEHQYWTFDVERSMFDVQSFHCSIPLKFHMRYMALSAWPSDRTYMIKKATGHCKLLVASQQAHQAV